jgi:capsid protein
METDFETGKKKAVLHIINSNDAVTTMMKDIKTMYVGGLMSHIIKVTDENLDGRGKVNMAFVNNSKEIINELIHKVKTTNKHDLTQADITKLVKLLKDFGIIVQEDILKKAIAKDSTQPMA